MSRVALSPLIATALFAGVVQAQSAMEFQTGTHVEVTAGADICADNVVINGTYSGDGTQCGGALPVELLSMACSVERSNVTLMWETATETENYGWEVERRNMGMLEEWNDENSSNNPAFHPSIWISLGFVKGAGTSSSPRNYSFTDKPGQPGRYAYRIKQIDLDGSFTYTDAVEVEMSAPGEFLLHQNYPNPFNPTTTIQYELPKATRVRLALYDMSGRQVRELVDETQSAGYHSVLLRADGLASGTYLCRIDAGGFVAVKRLTILK